MRALESVGNESGEGSGVAIEEGAAVAIRSAGVATEKSLAIRVETVAGPESLEWWRWR